MPNFISEDQIEQALVQKLQHLHGFDALDCYTEDAENLNDGSRRASKRDVILVDRVRDAATRLNPKVPAQAIDSALEKLLDRRLAMSLVAANQEVYNLLRDGIPVEFDDAKGHRQQQRVRPAVAGPQRNQEAVACADSAASCSSPNSIALRRCSGS